MLSVKVRSGRRANSGLWLMAAALAIAALTGALVVFGIIYGKPKSERLAASAAQHQAIETQATSLMQAMVDVETGQRGYTIVQRDDYLQPYTRGEKNAAAAEAALATSTRADRELRVLFVKTATLKARALEAIDQGVALVRSGHRQKAVELMITDVAKRRMDDFRDAVGALRSASDARALAVERDMAKARQRFTGLFSLLVLVVAVLIGGAAFFFARDAAAFEGLARQLEETNAALAAARARAEEADAAKTRFLATAGHDMRQPLHALTLYLAALKRRVDGAQAREIVASMEQAAGSLTRMFSGLLDLARIEAGVLRPHLSIVEIGDVMERLGRELRDDAERARVDLRFVPSRARLRTDPELLESILRNLITNAIKYAPSGPILVGCRRKGDSVRIEVIDRGPGIPQEKLAIMFGEFVRLEHAGGAKEGLGLGLSIASRLARLLNLNLEVSSAPGKGTTFWLTGRPEVQAKSAPETFETASAQLPGVVVAVKEDEPMAQAAIARVLADAGAIVHAYSTVDEFSRAVGRGAVHDLVIGDLALLQGSEASGSSAAKVRPPATIIITGSTDSQTLAVLEARGLPWLIKPVSENALLTLAARLVSAQRRVEVASP